MSVNRVKKPRYTLAQLKEMAVTREDRMKLAIIEDRHSDPTALMIKTALNLNTSETHVSGIYNSYLRGNVLWFSCEDEQLESLFESGLSDVDIASKMNTTRGSIQGRRKKLGLRYHKKVEDEDLLVFKIKKCIDRKITRKQAANELGVSDATVGLYCKKHGLSFRKYGSDHHASKVNAYDRSLICTLRDKGYLPEHISKVVDHDVVTIRSVLYYSPSTEPVDLSGNDRVSKLLNCEIDGGQYITPAQVEFFNKHGIDEYIKKVGCSEEAALMAFVYGSRVRKYEQLAMKSVNGG